MPFQQINHEDIYYTVEGTGPALLLLHSLGACGEMRSESVARWKHRATVITMDCRGHGRSSNNSGATLEAAAADVHSLLLHLDIVQADVVGLSMGGPIAAWLNAQANGLIRRLVLADTFMRISQGEEKAELLSAKLATMTMHEFAKEYVALTLLPETPSERHRQLESWIAGMSAQNYLETGLSIFSQNVEPQFAAMRCPVLVIAGEHDKRTPPLMAADIARQIHGARAGVIPAAGHLAPIDNPQGFHAEVEQFLFSD
jgi:3-oxoadipate enol-lactonase